MESKTDIRDPERMYEIFKLIKEENLFSPIGMGTGLPQVTHVIFDHIEKFQNKSTIHKWRDSMYAQTWREYMEAPWKNHGGQR